jgi:hypothetical protein
MFQGELPAKQIRHIVDMLTKEEMLEVEKHIEILLEQGADKKTEKKE